jgi:CRP-like cAMP-binding protein
MIPRERLEGLRFLHDLPAADLARVSEIAELQEVPGGKAIFREGERLSQVFVVLSGRVSLEIRVPGKGLVQIHTVGSGELLGWSPLLGEGPMTASARTLGPCQLVALDANQLLVLMRHDPVFGMELLRRTASALAQRLSATRLQLLDVFRHELPAVPDEGGHA